MLLRSSGTFVQNRLVLSPLAAPVQRKKADAGGCREEARKEGDASVKGQVEFIKEIVV